MKRVASIEGEFSAEEANLVLWMLGYASGAMVHDQAISRERAETAAKLADKVQYRTVFFYSDDALNEG